MHQSHLNPLFPAEIELPSSVYLYTSLTYTSNMLTIIETPTFTEDANRLWTEEERGAFCAWLAERPEVGDVIPGSGGCRKVRWSRQGAGKRGGVRVIYFLRLQSEEIWLLVIYAKSVQGNIPAHILRQVKETIEDG
ncbi:transcriptional regulator [Microbulbifer discodermiae]|uniref:transcriptional regulator n=1 Tax=Microbulbifer sp. 2201CG32-9 TaxID=3232309 RepID=UPI00345B8032